jgi:mannose-1-phosphate guanylyltransferase
MAAGQDPLMLVLAADHSIRNTPAFQAAIVKAIPMASQGAMVTFGIIPSAPETGYGYIHMGAAVADGIHKVDAFVEKPSRDLAAKYLSTQEYLWNSGMFLFRASKYLEELARHRPDIHAACMQSMKNTVSDLDFVRVDKESFLQCPSESIDYAVMEKTADAVVVPMDADWSDIGAFGALWDVLPHDADGNVHRGDVVSIDCQNNLVLAEDALVATIGLQDMVIVQTKDALLVAPRDRAQDVKSVVAKLKADNRPEYQLHKQVYRPWGKYESVDDGSRYQVKRITVNPGGKLSVQMHHHRAEHWIVVTGTARVTLEGQPRLLSENESIYLPLGATHCLENPGKIPLELIEVQVGSYLGEDDIVRFEDQYGRN